MRWFPVVHTLGLSTDLAAGWKLSVAVATFEHMSQTPKRSPRHAQLPSPSAGSQSAVSAEAMSLPSGIEYVRAIAELYVLPEAPLRPDDESLIDDLEFVAAAEQYFGELSRDELLELLSATGRATSRLGAIRLDLIAVLHARRAIATQSGSSPSGPNTGSAAAPALETPPKQPAAG